MNSEEKQKRIEYLKSRVYGDGKIIIADNDGIPESFAQDMSCIFGCDPEMDILCGAERGDEYLADCTVVVIENDISREEILAKLADYVNGTKIEFIACAFKETDGKMQYELYPNDEYVEGGYELFVTDVVVLGDCTNLLIELPLSLGMPGNGKPSNIALEIANGKHFAKELYDTDDSKLI